MIPLPVADRLIHERNVARIGHRSVLAFRCWAVSAMDAAYTHSPLGELFLGATLAKARLQVFFGRLKELDLFPDEAEALRAEFGAR